MDHDEDMATLRARVAERGRRERDVHRAFVLLRVAAVRVRSRFCDETTQPIRVLHVAMPQR